MNHPSRPTRTFLGVLIGLLMGVTTAASGPALAGAGTDQPTRQQAPHRSQSAFLACHYKSGIGQRFCVWDARHNYYGMGGTHRGRSYLSVRWGKHLKHQRVVHISHHKAHRLMGLG